jgi:hypothetical protein
MPLHHDLTRLAKELVDRNPAAPVEADLRRSNVPNQRLPTGELCKLNRLPPHSWRSCIAGVFRSGEGAAK